MLFRERKLLQSVVIAALASCISGVCDTDYDNTDVTETCVHVYKALESALVSDAGNLYRLRKAFFPAPGAELALLRVKYGIDFAPNETNSSVSCYTGKVGNSTLINTTTLMEYVYGWSLTGIYTVLDPLTINLMQIQLPFMLLRLIKLSTNTDGDPEVSTFLWDGTYDLPTVSLSLFVNSLNCTPTDDVFKSSINELTMTLKAYAKFQGIPTDYNKDEAGFFLEKDKVTASSTAILIFIGVFYYGAGFVLIGVAWITFHTEVQAELEKIKEYKLLYVLIGILDVVVVLSEFVQVIVVATHTREVASGMFIGKVWWMLLTPLIFAVGCICNKCSSVTEQCVLLVLGQLIFSSLLPTFLLLLVYPIKVISLFAYVVTFIYFVVYFLLALKSTAVKKDMNICFHLTLIMLLYLLYFTAFLFVLLFLLIMTKAAVFAPGVYGVIPLLPPAFITAGIWILKTKLLTKKSEREELKETTDGYSQL